METVRSVTSGRAGMYAVEFSPSKSCPICESAGLQIILHTSVSPFKCEYVSRLYYNTSSIDNFLWECWHNHQLHEKVPLLGCDLSVYTVSHVCISGLCSRSLKGSFLGIIQETLAFPLISSPLLDWEDWRELDFTTVLSDRVHIGVDRTSANLLPIFICSCDGWNAEWCQYQCIR